MLSAPRLRPRARRLAPVWSAVWAPRRRGRTASRRHAGAVPGTRMPRDPRPRVACAVSPAHSRARPQTLDGDPPDHPRQRDWGGPLTRTPVSVDPRVQSRPSRFASRPPPGPSQRVTSEAGQSQMRRLVFSGAPRVLDRLVYRSSCVYYERTRAFYSSVYSSVTRGRCVLASASLHSTASPSDDSGAISFTFCFFAAAPPL